MKLLTRSDFKITPAQFDFSNPHHMLRIWCGLYFFPAALGKFEQGEGFAPFLTTFFGQAGFSFPNITFWIYLAVSIEIMAGIGLVTGICIRWLSLLGAAELLFACYALIMNNGFVWSWNEGGVEYPLFWAFCCLCIAHNEWKKFLSINRIIS